MRGATNVDSAQSSESIFFIKFMGGGGWEEYTFSIRIIAEKPNIACKGIYLLHP